MVRLQPKSLVKRGEFLLSFDVSNNWNTELKEMNKDKVGKEPFRYQIHFFFCLEMPKCTFISLIDRQKEGIAQGHAKGKVPSIPDYTTISRRINKLDIKIKDDNKSKEFENDYIIIAIDSIGIKVTNRGQWMRRDKWNIKKERVFENTCSRSGCEKQENPFYEGSRR